MVLLENIGDFFTPDIDQGIFIQIINTLPVQDYLAAGKLVQAADDVQEGGLAAAGRPMMAMKSPLFTCSDTLFKATTRPSPSP